MKLLSLVSALTLLFSAPNVYAWGTVSASMKTIYSNKLQPFRARSIRIAPVNLSSSREQIADIEQLGHETVAYIASNFVASETKTFFQNILRNDTASYLAGVATWADSFRYTAAGRFSAPFHFIDANDSPPDSCGVIFPRDCPEKGCVISAIQNYVRLI